MINWKSNVFPGILGRTCDRPCEPACRRGRVEEEPVAICRLKRVAADYKGDISDRMPRRTDHRNGKKIALVGAGPASLTVARDLAPLGYHCRHLRRRRPRRRHDPQPNPEIPPARRSHRRGSRLHHRSGPRDAARPAGRQPESACWPRITTRSSSAPARRAAATWTFPGRQEAAANIHIGIDWLSSVSFGHINKIGRRVIVLGGGNTAMDCCRSSRRLGGDDVKVIVRSGFEEMKASPWEKQDAIHEDIPILNFLVPKEFKHDDGRLYGMTFEKVHAEYDARGRRRLVPTGEPDQFFECDDVLVAVGQENAFPVDRARHRPRIQRMGHARRRRNHLPVHQPRVFFGGDSAFGPKNIIWAVAHGHQAAISIHQLCQGEDVKDRPPPMVTLASQKMGIHEWSYDNDISLDLRFKVPHRDKLIALKDIKAEVELGFDDKLAFAEAQRCLNCDVQTVFTDKLCIECDACVDICPVDCISFTDDGAEAELRTRLSAPAHNHEQALYVSGH